MYGFFFPNCFWGRVVGGEVGASLIQGFILSLFKLCKCISSCNHIIVQILFKRSFICFCCIWFMHLSTGKKPYIYFFACINWNFETWLVLKLNGWKFQVEFANAANRYRASVLRAPELNHGAINWKIPTWNAHPWIMRYSSGVTIKLRVWMCQNNNLQASWLWGIRWQYVHRIPWLWFGSRLPLGFVKAILRACGWLNWKS